MIDRLYVRYRIQWNSILVYLHHLKLYTIFEQSLYYTFQTLGNHEFDDGVKDVQSFLRNITIPVVVSNIDLSDEPSLANIPNLMKSKVLTIKGRKIGIVGYLTPETAVSNELRLLVISGLMSVLRYSYVFVVRRSNECVIDRHRFVWICIFIAIDYMIW